jgi:hypothetical protein
MLAKNVLNFVANSLIFCTFWVNFFSTLENAGTNFCFTYNSLMSFDHLLTYVILFAIESGFFILEEKWVFSLLIQG